MKTYQVYIQSAQTWTYVYEVEAKNEEEAHLLGEKRHFDGGESSDNWIDNEDFLAFQVIEGAL